MGRETGAGGAPRGGRWSPAPQGPWQGRAHWASRRPAPTPAGSGCHLRMLGFHFITGLCTHKKKNEKFSKREKPAKFYFLPRFFCACLYCVFNSQFHEAFKSANAGKMLL